MVENGGDGLYSTHGEHVEIRLCLSLSLNCPSIQMGVRARR